jgi:hypothetical protein
MAEEIETIKQTVSSEIERHFPSVDAQGVESDGALRVDSLDVKRKKLAIYK